MGWKQYVRSVEAAQRREERAAQRRYRDVMREHARMEKEAEKQDAAREVARYEWYVDLLVSLHSETVSEQSWQQHMSSAPPQPPARQNIHEREVQSQIATYQPGFIEKLFGGAKKRAAELEAQRIKACAADDAEFRHAHSLYERDYASWKKRRELAPHVLSFDIRAAREALKDVGSFRALDDFRTKVTLAALDPSTATVTCVLEDPDLVPTDEVKLTASGRVSTKEMPAGKYWTLYQDHVCSCAIRVGREALAAIPIQRCIVNVHTPRINTATGHVDLDCILAVQFTKRGLSNLRLETIDPSDAMRNFNHRMKFKKASGFETVEPSSTEEAWVTT